MNLSKLENNFKNTSDDELTKYLQNLLKQEKQIGDSILLALKEIKTRRIYAGLGYSSLFEMLVKHFHLSETSSYQRLNALKLMESVPTAAKEIFNGDLSLTNAASVQSFILRSEKEQNKPMTLVEKTELITAVKNKSTKEAQQILAAINPVAVIPKQKEKVITEKLTQLQILVDQETLSQFKHVQSLLSHNIPDGDCNQILKLMTAEMIVILQKRKGIFIQTKDPKNINLLECKNFVGVENKNSAVKRQDSNKAQENKDIAVKKQDSVKLAEKKSVNNKDTEPQLMESNQKIRTENYQDVNTKYSGNKKSKTLNTEFNQAEFDKVPKTEFNRGEFNKVPQVDSYKYLKNEKTNPIKANTLKAEFKNASPKNLPTTEKQSVAFLVKKLQDDNNNKNNNNVNVNLNVNRNQNQNRNVNVNQNVNRNVNVNQNVNVNRIQLEKTNQLINLASRYISAEIRPRNISTNSRYVSAEIKKSIFTKANNRCQYISITGHRCNSQHQLEMDHIHPISQGGDHQENNLRVLCRAHNQYRTKHTHGFWYRPIR